MSHFGTLPPRKCCPLHKTAGLLPIDRKGKAPRGTESFKPSPAHNCLTPNCPPDRTRPGSQVLSSPSGKLVLVCRWRKDKRKAQQQGASRRGDGPPCTLQASKPSVLIVRVKRESVGVFSPQKGFDGGGRPKLPVLPALAHHYILSVKQDRTRSRWLHLWLALETSPYLAVLVDRYQAFDRNIADVTPAEEDLS